MKDFSERNWQFYREYWPILRKDWLISEKEILRVSENVGNVSNVDQEIFQKKKSEVLYNFSALFLLRVRNGFFRWNLIFFHIYITHLAYGFDNLPYKIGIITKLFGSFISIIKYILQQKFRIMKLLNSGNCIIIEILKSEFSKFPNFQN